jgi:hypothetical protein
VDFSLKARPQYGSQNWRTKEGEMEQRLGYNKIAPGAGDVLVAQIRRIKCIAKV